MKMVPFVCPNCGGQLNVAEGKTHMKCGWCGSDLLITPDKKGDGVNVQMNININIERDEARIREADVKDNQSQRSHDTIRSLGSNVIRVLSIIPVILLVIGGLTGKISEAAIAVGGFALFMIILAINTQ